MPAIGSILALREQGAEGKLKIFRRDQDFQVATNFYLPKPSLGWYPCKRYVKVTEALTGLMEPSVDAIRSNLASVAGKGTYGGEEAGTLYSNVYDLRKREVIVYYKQAFDSPLKIRLAEELNKGAHTIELQKAGR